ncbi:hypothetical protein XENTR_v10019195 [Xenopus tropicalis]|nr:hypothetical protein XENTR_v10019195 [Xenopus tropicalis]
MFHTPGILAFLLCLFLSLPGYIPLGCYLVFQTARSKHSIRRHKLYYGTYLSSTDRGISVTVCEQALTQRAYSPIT